MSERPRWDQLRDAFAAYARGRLGLLKAIGAGASNRDPLSEFSEQLIAGLVGGELAKSRVQRGWDLTTPEGRKVQVKYLASPGGGEVCVNGVELAFGGGEDNSDDFAVVFFGALLPIAVLVVGREHRLDVCARLRKRHPGDDGSVDGGKLPAARE